MIGPVEITGSWAAFPVAGTRVYTVLLGTTGEVACDCPAYEFRVGHGPCKHILEVLTNMSNLLETLGAAKPDVAARLAALRAQASIIRSTVLPPGTTDEQLRVFLLICASYDLDPIREVWAFPKRGSAGGLQIIPGAEAYLRRAQEHPLYGGLTFGVVREGDEFAADIDQGRVTHRVSGFPDPKAAILGAWCVAEVKGQRPVVVLVPLAEARRDSDVWKQNPWQMLVKEAVKRACKYAFGLKAAMDINAAPTLTRFEPGTEEDPGDGMTILADATDLPIDPVEPLPREVDAETGEVLA